MTLDALSFSPSLPLILSFIDPKDIVNCQLSSCRFNDVILRNPLLMPRTVVAIKITYQRIGAIRRLYVSVKTLKKENKDVFWIGNDKTEIDPCDDHRVSILQYYSEQGYEVSSPRTLLSPNPGMDESLRLLFRLLFRRYHIHYIMFHCLNLAGPEDAREWLRIICREFKEGRTRCRSMHIELNQPNMNYLFGQFGSARLSISEGNKLSLQEKFELIPRWDRPITIRVSANRLVNLQPIIDFLKRWARGKCGRVKHVRLYHKQNNGLHYRWSYQEVSEILAENRVAYLPDDEATFYIAHYTERRRFLRFKYPKEPTTITISEATLECSDFDYIWGS